MSCSCIRCGLLARLAATIRTSYHVGEVPSRRRRPARQLDTLRRLAALASVYELQGDLMFAGAERVVRTVVDASDQIKIAVLDLRAVDRIADPAARILVGLHETLSEQGRELALVIKGSQSEWAETIDLGLDELRCFRDIDAAREWCEDRLIMDAGVAGEGLEPVTLTEHRLCDGLEPDQFARLKSMLNEKQFDAGDAIIRAGTDANEIFLLLAGEVAIVLPGENGTRRRLATLPPGSIFGELAVLGDSIRTADVTAQTAVNVMTLDAAEFAELERSAPALKARMLHNMLASAYEAVARMSLEVAALGRNQ